MNWLPISEFACARGSASDQEKTMGTADCTDFECVGWIKRSETQPHISHG